ncbi:MAG: YdcF family protein [Verrucomicrobia subdivision 3 bacterium]|nr:YdcF family protein [Limisphaerales bacterium]
MAALAKALLQPVALLWLTLLGLAGWFIYKRKYRLAAMQGGLALALFFVGSSPLSDWLLSRLEAPYGRTSWATLPEADAVLVLGGIGGGAEVEINGIDFSAAVDRVLTGIELTRRGKAPVLVLGGGGYWKNGKLEPEAECIRPWIEKWKLAEDIPVHDLGVCANTFEESQKFAALARKEGWETILLVTSASHMKRAEAVFRSSGVDVRPVACDFAAWPYRGDWNFFPSIDRLKAVQIWMYESVGWMYYRSKGWIQLEALPEK